jgi:hypothetical protein
MQRNFNHFSFLVVASLALSLAVSLPGAAQGQRPMARGMMGQNQDPLAPLKNALQAAGATALSVDQETNINNLITNFRGINRPAAPSTDVQAARLNYDKAILAGDLAAADNQIQLLVNDQMSQTNARMQAEAAFAVSVVKAIFADQLSALQQRMGSGGLVGLLGSLGGGPGRGPGGPGPGRGMQGQAGAQGPMRGAAIKK